jgi:transcriptional regulator with XRE-family HTH domain
MQVLAHNVIVLYKHIVLNIDKSIVCAYKRKMNPELLYQHIGTTIKQKRKKLEWTQEELARRMAMSRAALANIETGRQNVLVHQLYGFAAALGLRIEDLLPQADNVDLASSSSDFPLPKNLSRVQKEQLTRLLNETAVPVAPEKEES